jgi:hypothetical protein
MPHVFDEVTPHPNNKKNHTEQQRQDCEDVDQPLPHLD